MYICNITDLEKVKATETNVNGYSSEEVILMPTVENLVLTATEITPTTRF